MPTAPIFKTPIDFASTLVAAARSIGSPTLYIVDGSVFGDPTPSAPVRVTVASSAARRITHLIATARSGDALTVAVEAGYSDLATAPGDPAAVTPSGAALKDIHAAILALFEQGGTPGPKGDTGEAGPAGADGQDGATWYSAGTTPSSAIGADGDYYLNTATGVVYLKSGGSWGPIGNLKGPQGDAGATGATGSAGSDGADGVGVPAGGTAGQVLAKASSADFDTGWATHTGGTPAGATGNIQVNVSGAFSGSSALTSSADLLLETRNLTNQLANFEGSVEHYRMTGLRPGSTQPLLRFYEWFNGTAGWIDMPTTGPSGIGQGGPGVQVWVAYARGASNYFADAVGGEIVYLGPGGLLLGNNYGSSVLRIYGNAATVAAFDASTTPLTVKGHVSQAAPLQSWADSTGAPLVSIPAVGALTLSAAIADSAAPVNSLFRGSDHSGSLCFKDGSGTVHQLY